MIYVIAPLNGGSSRVFLNHIDKYKLFDTFQHIQTNNV